MSQTYLHTSYGSIVFFSPNMCSTVGEGLDYLNNRKTFWDQHGPKEKRKKEKVQIYQVACSDNSKF